MSNVRDNLLSSFPFACQAYDDEASAREFCAENNLTLVGMVEVDPAVTARIKADESGPLAFLEHVLPPDNNPWGDVVFNPSTKVLDISLRGTGSGLEWIADALCRLVVCRYFNGRCHEGMQLVFDCINESLKKLIRKTPGDTSLIRVHGHSLGCHLAAMAAKILKSGTSLPIQVFLWESPRFFDVPTAAEWNAALPNSYRIVNEFDIVCQIPTHAMGYGDIGGKVEVHGGWKWDDPKVAHHLETGPGPGVQELA